MTPVEDQRFPNCKPKTAKKEFVEGDKGRMINAFEARKEKKHTHTHTNTQRKT